MTAAWNHDGVVNTVGSVSAPPTFKSFFFFIFFKGGGKKKKLQQINKTINFLIYLLQRAGGKKSQWGKHSTWKFPSEITPQAVGYLEIDIFNFLTA